MEKAVETRFGSQWRSNGDHATQGVDQFRNSTAYGGRRAKVQQKTIITMWLCLCIPLKIHDSCRWATQHVMGTWGIIVEASDTLGTVVWRLERRTKQRWRTSRRSSGAGLHLLRVHERWYQCRLPWRYRRDNEGNRQGTPLAYTTIFPSLNMENYSGLVITIAGMEPTTKEHVIQVYTDRL